MTEAELKKMTVKQLRELAAEKTSLSGLTSMKKDVLVLAIIEELGVETEKKVKGEVLQDKKTTKQEILRLKQKKQGLLQQKPMNPKQLRNIRRRLKKLKRHLQKVS